VQKYGPPETTGWSPRRRFKSGYYLPSDVYECLVSLNIATGCSWLDVGGGHSIFPNNADLARTLVSRCDMVVAVDPSENVLKNPFVHERVRSTLEDYAPSRSFDLATLRMVVEHVRHPEPFVRSLARLIKPGGIVIVFTVNRWSPVTIVSGLLPFSVHHRIKQRFWGGEEEDTFPVHYRMNSRAVLRALFEQADFTEEEFTKPDDLSTFGNFRWLNYAELAAWRGLRSLGLPYPENCLLGLYRR